MKYRGPGLSDEAFYRGKAPMTKSEVRAVTISKLRLSQDAKVLDIGAGSGSITVKLHFKLAKDTFGVLREKMTHLKFFKRMLSDLNWKTLLQSKV